MAKGSTQDAFLSGLEELLLSEGIRDLTVAQIAARLHCSRRRLYELAASKEELFCAMVERFFHSALVEGEAVLAREADPTVALSGFLNVGVRTGARVGAAFLRDVEAIDSARAIFDRYQEARTDRLRELIDDGVARGVFAPCHGRLVAEVILGAALRLRRPDFLARAGLTIDEAFAEFYRTLLGGLLVKGTAPG